MKPPPGCYQNRHSTYYLRLCLPKAFRHYTQQHDIRISLRTRQIKTAHRRSLVYQLRASIVFKWIRAVMTDNCTGINLPPFITDAEKDQIWDNVIDIEGNHYAALTFILNHGIRWIRSANPDIDDPWALLTYDDREDVGYAAIKLDCSRLVVPEKKAAQIAPIMAEPSIITPTQASSALIDDISKYSIRQVAELYLKENTKKKPADIELILAILGNAETTPFNTLTARAVAKCKETLVSLPRYITAEKYLQGKFDSNTELASPATIKPKIEVLRGICTYAKKNFHHPRNIGEDLEYKLPRRHKQEAKYNTFSDHQIKLICNSWVYGNARPKGQAASSTKDYYFWMPLIGLYTGARLGEIIQLEITDVGETKGIPYLHFTNEEEEATDSPATSKSVKTESSKRKVPIHPKLIEIGLLKFVQQQRDAGEKFLLPGAHQQKADMRSAKQAASKWFSRHSLAIKLRESADRKNVNHSFRHTFTTKLRHAGIDDTLIKALTGHVDHMYGLDHQIQIRHEAIQKLNYSIDISHMNFDAKFRKLQGNKRTPIKARRRPKRS